jgi:hypothetical protein
MSALDITLCNRQIEQAVGKKIFGLYLSYDMAEGLAAIERALGAKIFNPYSLLDPNFSRHKIDAAIASNTGSDPWASLDGRLNAPVGAPQYPTLLNGYLARPPWKVAGVDYRVGYPSGQVFKDPATISMTGVLVDLGQKVVQVQTDNITLDGYDFTLAGGWVLGINIGNNCIVKNCKFLTGSNNSGCLFVDQTASNAHISYCVFDGNGLVQTNSIATGCNGTGTCIWEYNWFKSAWGEDIVNSSDIGGENWIYRYNIIENAGEGFNTGGHGDWLQSYNAIGKDTNSIAINFNLCLQSIDISLGRTQGLSLFSANSGPTSGGCHFEEVKNNTFIGLSGAYVNYAIIVDTTRLIGSATLSQNYFDLSGIGSANGGGGNWSYTGNYNGASGGPYNGTVVSNGNINMITGSSLT